MSEQKSSAEWVKSTLLMAQENAALRLKVEGLERERTQYAEEAADFKAQLREESQDSIDRLKIIDGLRSERARHTEIVEKLKAQLTTAQGRVKELEAQAKLKPGDYAIRLTG